MEKSKKHLTSVHHIRTERWTDIYRFKDVIDAFYLTEKLVKKKILVKRAMRTIQILSKDPVKTDIINWL